MSIVRWPDVPDVQGSLRIPRPSIYLLGSSQTTEWYIKAARQLDQYFGSVFFCDDQQPKNLVDYTKWVFNWLLPADLAFIWIDRPPINAQLLWDQLEVGICFGQRKPMVLAIHPSLDSLSLALRAVLNELGIVSPIYSTLEMAVEATKMRRGT